MRSVALLFLLALAPCRATIVAHTIAASGTGNNVTTSSINTTGALSLFLIVTQNATPSGSLSDSKGNTWIGLTAQTPFGTGNLRMYYCVATPTVGTGHTFTWTSTGQLPSIAVIASDQAYVFGSESGAAVGADSVQPGSLTPSAINALIVTGEIDVAVGSSATVDQGFTISDANNVAAGVSYGTRLAYIEETSIVAKNPTWQTTPSLSNNMAAVMAVFVPGSAPSGSVRHASSIL